MAKQPSIKAAEREVLLKEYEFSQKTAENMENTIWQSSAVIGVGLFGSFLLIALRGTDSQPPWYIACVVGPIVFVLSLIWWLVARRWWSVQHAMFLRMRHIERRLGMHSLNYIGYLDHAELVPKEGLSATERTEIKERRERNLFLGVKDHQRKGVQEFIWVFPLLLLFAWMGYAIILFIVQVFCAG
jgi:hypothetical protein